MVKRANVWSAAAALMALSLGAPALADDPREEAARPEWTNTFTFRVNEAESGSFWSGAGDDLVEIPAGSNWGFTLSLNDGRDVFDLDGLEAGAFFDVTPRFRFGGALTFPSDSALADVLWTDPSKKDAPEIKFESNLKF